MSSLFSLFWFFPTKHYWPIKEDDKCRSIKFAVEWGNAHQNEANSIGKAASDFIYDELKMDYVYDYMFHLLSSYGKLLRYTPTLSSEDVELCVESMWFAMVKEEESNS
ncbi:hypothetical protein PIB30_027655 [Stylosanthes scabra]|uniref:Glycosyl transferase CAP10 domain-containing protein n=1 Tax=Stylosanthes scabra TaxID=79078 RepID=A0ABU6RB81_9FABA|nr:hypothetical protein [Stylosanthes scabra]